MKFCDFCTCDDCLYGRVGLTHSKTIDDKWICDICWRYSICVTMKRNEHGYKYGEKSRGDCSPCEDENGRPTKCAHRPSLVGEWIEYTSLNCRID
jgi:hypothetical protein